MKRKIYYIITTFVVLIATTATVFAIKNTYKPVENTVNSTTKTVLKETATDNKETTKTETVPKTTNAAVVTTQKPTVTETTSTKVTTTKPKITVNNLNLKYSKDDLYYLAAAVCREAGGCSEEVQLLVANVIMNRVASPLYPNTIYGVLTQYMQYGMMWKNGVSFPDWATNDVKDQCYSVARRILNGERVCPENVLFQAEFKQGNGVYKELDGFYFCYY